MKGIMESPEGHVTTVSVLTLGRELSVLLPRTGRPQKAQVGPSAPWKPAELQLVHTNRRSAVCPPSSEHVKRGKGY